MTVKFLCQKNVCIKKKLWEEKNLDNRNVMTNKFHNGNILMPTKNLPGPMDKP